MSLILSRYLTSMEFSLFYCSGNGLTTKSDEPVERIMNITYVTVGSDGDIKPAIALSLGLQKVGHQVNLAYCSNGVSFDNHKEYISKWGLESIALDEEEYIPSNLWNICQNTDAIISSDAVFYCSYIAEKLKIPYFVACMLPFYPTRAFPYAYASSKSNLGHIFNWMSYHFFDRCFWQSRRKPINQWRQEVLNLPPLPYWSGIIHWIQQKQIPCLYSHSPVLLPKPPDWPDWVHITGYWGLDDSVDWQPPKNLVEFLEAGSPPVYIGFGNKGGWDAEKLTKLVLEALGRSRQRGILLIGEDFSD